MPEEAPVIITVRPETASLSERASTSPAPGMRCPNARSVRMLSEAMSNGFGVMASGPYQRRRLRGAVGAWQTPSVYVPAGAGRRAAKPAISRAVAGWWQVQHVLHANPAIVEPAAAEWQVLQAGALA